MNFVDIIIILFIISCAIVGAKHGIIKQAAYFIGTFLSFVLAFYLKDYLANFLSYTFPFFKFSGSIEGLVSLNILIYQFIAFGIILSICSILSGLLVKVASMIENLLTATIILSIPSRILGFIFGIIEGYLVVFIVLFVLSQPFINFKYVNNSKFKDPILNSSPVISSIIKDTNNTAHEVYSLVNDYKKDKDKDKFNRNCIDIMISKKIIKVGYVKKLVKLNKLNVPKLNTVIDKY